MFVVTTVFDREDGKRIVHSWGPFETRSLASSAVQSMKRSDQRAIDSGEITAKGKITYHTGEVMSAEPGPLVEA